MNKYQKRTIIIGAAIIVISLIVWQIYGGEIFTKTQVLVKEHDELFDTTYEKWVDKFVWGLDLSLVISGITVLISAILYFIFRKKNK